MSPTASGRSRRANRGVEGAENITIRQWRAKDRPAVEALLKLLSDEAEVTAMDAPTYVAEQDKVVVGLITLCTVTTLTGAKAYLDDLVVAHGSRRSGIGRMLVEYAIERARDAGASRVDLTANATKQAGHSLYRSLGFEQRDTSNFRLHVAPPEEK